MSAQAWPEGDAFVEDLNRLTKPSSSKITSLAEQALSLHRHYKNVVHAIEKFVRKSTRDTRLLGLYVLDALLRRSRQKFVDASKDVYSMRLASNMLLTFAKIVEVRSGDLPRIGKVLAGWRTKGIFDMELQEEMEAIYESAAASANPEEDERLDAAEAKERAREAASSPVAPLGEAADSSPPRDVSPAQRVAAPVPSQSQPAAPKPAAAPAPSGASRDPRRAAHAAAQQATAPSAFPTPATFAQPAAVAPAAPAPQRSLSIPAAAVPQPAPLPPPAQPAPAPATAAAVVEDWAYSDDEEDDEDEDEEKRKEKLRLRLEKEKAQMEAAAIPELQSPSSSLQQPFSQMSYPGAAAPADAAGAGAAAPRRSRFGAPKSAAEVAAGLAAQGVAPPASISIDRRSPPRDGQRQRSRSRSRERDNHYQQQSSRPTGGRPGRDQQNPGFVRLPDSEQSGSSHVKVLSTTLRVGHAPLSSLGLDPSTARSKLQQLLGVFGQIDWTNATETQSYVRFRTRRDAARAKSHPQQFVLGGQSAQLTWARARQMDKEMWAQHSGEGVVPADDPSLASAPVEAVDPDADVDFGSAAPNRRGRAPAADAPPGRSAYTPQMQQRSGPESYPVAGGWSQPSGAAPSAYGAQSQQQQQQQQAPQLMAPAEFAAAQQQLQQMQQQLLAQQQQMQQYQQMQQQQSQPMQTQSMQAQPPKPAGGASGSFHPSRPWLNALPH